MSFRATGVRTPTTTGDYRYEITENPDGSFYGTIIVVVLDQDGNHMAYEDALISDLPQAKRDALETWLAANRVLGDGIIL